MEKLQKALSKARRDRDDAAQSAPPSVAAPPAPQDARAVPGLPAAPEAAPITTASIWEDLEPFNPDPALLERNRVLTLNSKIDARPFDILRTKVFLMMREKGWTRLAIISPDKGCGKTTTACNLAVGFSRQREIRSMLFDLDLRQPGVAKMLGLAPKRDIRDLLLGETTAQEQMVSLRGNVAISAAGNPVSDPAQLLLAERTTRAFADLQALFEPDIMIFDLPPMLVTDDARAMLKNVDCALIVVRAEHTRMSHLDVCEREVGQHTNVLGVVVNNCRHMASEDHNLNDYS